MTAAGSFSFDHGADGILLSRLCGFLSPADGEAYGREMLSHVTVARRTGKPLRLLIDSTQGGVQSPEMLATMEALLGNVLASSNDRLAFVMTSSLLKMQTRRALPEALAKIFVLEADARAWLLQ